MDALVTFIVLIAFIVGCAMVYKNRHTVARWLNDTNLTISDEKRKKHLERVIEDSQKEISEIDARLNKQA